MITKQQKQQRIEKIKDVLQRAKIVIFCDYLGLTVAEITTLRRRLQEVDGDYLVIKNTLAKKALEGIDYINIDEYLKGPNAIAVSYNDPAKVAKIVLDFIKEVKKTSVKGAVLENKKIAPDELINIANLPPKEVLIGKLLGTLNAPATNLVYVLNALPSKLVRTLDAIKKQKEEAKSA